MKALCLDAAQAIVKRIKFLCERDDYSSALSFANEVRLLTKALSQLDNIIYAEREAERGEKE